MPFLSRHNFVWIEPHSFVWLEPHETVEVTETGFAMSPVSGKTAFLEKRGLNIDKNSLPIISRLASRAFLQPAPRLAAEAWDSLC